MICDKRLPSASRGRVRWTCSDRCRQIKKRYKGWHQWRDAVYTRVKERRIDKLLRDVERRIGTMDFPFNPAHPDLTMKTMVKRTFMRSLNARVENLTYCGNCGRPYVPKGNRWKYWEKCSESCARSYARNVKLESASFYANPRRMPEEVMDSLRRRKRVKLCAHCNGAFVPKGRRKYCTDKCKDAAYWKRRPRQRCVECGGGFRGKGKYCSKRCNARVYLRDALTCVRCHKWVRHGSGILPNAATRMPYFQTARRKAQPTVFCSERCRDGQSWVPAPKQCEWCQESYYPKSPSVVEHSRYCSHRCAEKALRLRNRQEWLVLHPRPCRECGGTIPNQIVRASYCSDVCKGAALERQRVEANARRRDKARVARESAQFAAEMPIPIPVEWLGVRVRVDSPP